MKTSNWQTHRQSTTDRRVKKKEQNKKKQKNQKNKERERETRLNGLLQCSRRWDSGWTASCCCRWRDPPRLLRRSSRSCRQLGPSRRRTWRRRCLSPLQCRSQPSSAPVRRSHRLPSTHSYEVTTDKLPVSLTAERNAVDGQPTVHSLVSCSACDCDT